MRFVYEEDTRAITIRETGRPCIEGNVIARIERGAESLAAHILAGLNGPLDRTRAMLAIGGPEALVEMKRRHPEADWDNL